MSLAPEHPSRVQVLRALKLGDLLLAVPAFRALRRAWPDSRIELIGLRWTTELIERLPGYIDRLVEFPGWPGVPERDVDPSRVSAFLAASAAKPPDLAIQLHGSGTSTNAFVAQLGATRTAGRFPPEDAAPHPETFVPFDETQSERRGLLAVLSAIGVPPAGEELEVQVLDRDRVEIAAGPAGALQHQSYAVVHPASSTRSRRWPADRFAVVADAIAERIPVVVTGTWRERSVAAQVLGRMRRPALDMTGRTSLGGLFALVDNAEIAVSNDTGVAHTAEALGTPSVVVFTVSDPRRWGPTDRTLHRVVANTPTDWPAPGAVVEQAMELLSLGVGA